MTKREEILERDQWTCHGCGRTATKTLLSYNVPERDVESYPDFAWVSVCPACAAEGNSGPPANDLMAWEQVAALLNCDAKEGQSLRLAEAIRDAQSRTVDFETIISLIRGANLIPSEELG